MLMTARDMLKAKPLPQSARLLHCKPSSLKRTHSLRASSRHSSKPRQPLPFHLRSWQHRLLKLQMKPVAKDELCGSWKPTTPPPPRTWPGGKRARPKKFTALFRCGWMVLGKRRVARSRTLAPLTRRIWPPSWPSTRSRRAGLLKFSHHASIALKATAQLLREPRVKLLLCVRSWSCKRSGCGISAGSCASKMRYCRRMCPLPCSTTRMSFAPCSNSCRSRKPSLRNDQRWT
mmetsp:Transcript_58606/g.156696  ORF Transcript_58606/g.156696 Transcript_58606/m.156696 type:complete len:232 (-) Transcript_58606:533-1228(-)